ncbi:XrtA/PEP-CTERM system histidine kinase PrsK [Erythrobacter sp. SCSIO 43205]|uniref:XrtA/PEP-CTERM system histidine kinase PrsK n=1 Tax=Erythrobacter sp. SCSIO 43205 TaxID=2779361 RepID=UPI0021080AE3|nr:XrtA/PEP-CTERM system histidine kinase PrsK [Erythrobacter sp. SCSIO 43205]
MAEITSLGPVLAWICYLAGAIASAGALVWIAQFGDPNRPDRKAVLAALATCVVWCSLSLAAEPASVAVAIAETARNLALLAVIFQLFAADGRDESLKPTRPVIVILVMVQLLQLLLIVVEVQASAFPEVIQLTTEISGFFSMMVAIGALVLLHNLYAGAASASRRIILWSGVGLGAFFAYDLNLHTLAYLGQENPPILVSLHGLVAAVMAVMIAFAANASSAGLEFKPSRAVTFQTLSLLVIGSYLIVMVIVTRSLALLGGDVGRASQIAFLVFAIAVAAIWLPSHRIRRSVRVMAAKHLFQHRYDYREEWLRFTRTIGHVSNNRSSFQERAVKALADITESPAGLLLMPNEEAQLELNARWSWPTLDVPALASDHVLPSLLEQHNHILALDEARAGIEYFGELAHIPQWLIEAEDAWALVPLIHFDRLVGVIVLARPPIERRLDWEDFDLLRVGGQQLASYLAEQAGQQALMDASRFDEFNRRMAFVMHDIKNIASQLSLLSRNAQKHADNPDFRADMLVTLRNSSDKLNILLDRLGRYGSGQAQEVRELDLNDLAVKVRDRFKGVHPVSFSRTEPVRVLGDAEALEQALIHLVQNAVDASESGAEVILTTSRDAFTGSIDVIDTGSGMTPEFVRTGLFKPFVSSKQGGFGIGAFEAREMIKGMGGRLTVESREGLGTRFSASLPVPEAARLRGANAPAHTISDEQTQSKEEAA